jgi:hypothetical protein
MQDGCPLSLEIDEDGVRIAFRTRLAGPLQHPISAFAYAGKWTLTPVFVFCPPEKKKADQIGRLSLCWAHCLAGVFDYVLAYFRFQSTHLFCRDVENVIALLHKNSSFQVFTSYFCREKGLKIIQSEFRAR